MRVRIDKDVAKKVAASAKRNKRSHASEVSMALAEFYVAKTVSDSWSKAWLKQEKTPL